MVFIKRFLFFTLFPLLSFLFFLFPAEIQAAPLDAPTLIAPTETDIIGRPKPNIIGLTPSQSAVLIYIDGVYNGKIEKLSHPSGTANFSYKPFLNLKPGWHEAWAFSENDLKEKSLVSNTLKFKIELPMPAPTIFKPVVNAKTSYSQPFIVGLAKNDSIIKVYIDHRLSGQFLVTNHGSGTANFAFKPASPLSRGSHLAYAVALDSRGKESRWSNVVYFSVRQPVIADSAAEKKDGTVVKINEPIFEKKIGSDSIILPDGEISSSPALGMAVEDKLSKAKNVPEGQPNSVDEENLKQNRLSLNLFIFIIFILAVIAWILWVNRELSKERQLQERKDLE